MNARPVALRDRHARGFRAVGGDNRGMRADPERLDTLHRLMLLDSQPEQDWDVIAQRAAEVLGVPITMINLLDEHRDWFKACIGLPMSESPSSTSFCETMFTVDRDLLVVQDTLEDPRFRTHPLVVGPPHVRFYAAARLVVAGQTVGTLCAYDFVPRNVSDDALENMRTLAAAVMELMLLRHPRAASP
jgi:GAF domain-containing protein